MVSQSVVEYENSAREIDCIPPIVCHYKLGYFDHVPVVGVLILYTFFQGSRKLVKVWSVVKQKHMQDILNES